MAAYDEQGQQAIVGKTTSYWLREDDFVSTLELEASALGGIGFPRNWPAVYSSNKVLKQLIGKKGLCAGKKVGVTGTPTEEESTLVKDLTLLPLQSFANSEKVRDAKGWQIVMGWAVFEHLDCCVGEGFVAERYWWNAGSDGKWVDFTPRPEAWPELLLAEAAGDASKARSVLQPADLLLTQHLLTTRKLRSPPSLPLAGKVDAAEMNKAVAHQSSSSTEPVSKAGSVSKGSASLVDKAAAGDVEALKELEGKVKADEALGAEIGQDKQFLSALLSMLKDVSKKEVVLRLLLAISDAAVGQRSFVVKDAFVAAQAVPALGKLLRDSDETIKECVAAIFGNLSHESPSNQQVFCQAQLMGGLVDMLSGSGAAAEEAAYAIWNLTVGHEENSRTVEKLSGIPRLIALLKRPSDIAQENAAGALMHVTVSASAREAMMNHGALERLVELLSPEYEAEVNCQATGALLNMASDCPEAASKIVKCGAVKPLALLLREGLDLTKEYAAGALMNLIRNEAEVADQTAKADAIPALAGLLQRNIGASEALGALANLASGSDSRQAAIYKAQVTRKSVECLRDENLEVRRGAAALIMNLAPHKKIKERIVEAGALKPLSACLQDQDAVIRERAAGALANLFNDHAANVHAGFAQAPEMIPPLVLLLTAEDVSEDGRRQAAHALAMLAAEDGSCDAVWKAKAGPPLLQLLRAEVGEAALAIMNLAWRWPEVKKELVDGGALVPLLSMLQSRDATTKEYAAGAVMNMTAGTKEIAQKVQGSISDLAKLLRSENLQSAEWSAGALANIVRAGDTPQVLTAAPDAPAALAALLAKATQPGKALVVLSLTAFAEKDAEAVRKVLDTKAKAKLREFREGGQEDLATATVTLVQTLGAGFSL